MPFNLIRLPGFEKPLRILLPGKKSIRQGFDGIGGVMKNVDLHRQKPAKYRSNTGHENFTTFKPKCGTIHPKESGVIPSNPG